MSDKNRVYFYNKVVGRWYYLIFLLKYQAMPNVRSSNSELKGNLLSNLLAK